MLSKPCSSTENLLIPEAESYRGYVVDVTTIVVLKLRMREVNTLSIIYIRKELTYPNELSIDGIRISPEVINIYFKNQILHKDVFFYITGPPLLHNSNWLVLACSACFWGEQGPSLPHCRYKDSPH